MIRSTAVATDTTTSTVTTPVSSVTKTSALIESTVNSNIETTITNKHNSEDFNGDGFVSLADVIMIYRFIAEDTSLTQAQIQTILNANPDIDKNGMITIMDAATLLHQIKEKM